VGRMGRLGFIILRLDVQAVANLACDGGYIRSSDDDDSPSGGPSLFLDFLSRWKAWCSVYGDSGSVAGIDVDDTDKIVASCSERQLVPQT
jgi:hypothetical protein